MELWKDLLMDDVGLFTAGGFIIMLGIGVYFLIMFIAKSSKPGGR
ncbi:MAG: DUF3149 domain-containing protein [Thiotrichales bacterium]